MDAPFIDDSMADSGTAADLLKKKFPGMFTDSAAPTASPNPAPAPPTPPDIGGDPNASALNPSASGFGPSVQPASPGPAGPTKVQKLLQILQGGIQGALAGRASSEQALLASGGHRSGGVGMGFESGYELPWKRQAQQLGLQQQQAQIEATKSQGQMINTPSGPMPAWLAKAILPASIRGQSAENVADTQAGAKTDVADTAAAAKVQSAQIGQRFKVTPAGLFDTQTRTVMPETAGGVIITPEIAKDHDLPPQFIGKPLKVSDLNGLKRNEISAAPTVKSSTDPLGLTTTSTSSKVLPQPGGVPARPQVRGGGGGAAPAGGSGSNLDQMAKNLVEGNIDPSQVPKRGSSYTIIANKADTYSRNTYGKPFDMAAAASEYQYAKNPQTQNVLKLIDGITAKGGSLEIAMDAAKKLPKLDSQTLNNVFNLGATEFGSDEASNFHTAMLGLADEYSKVMGGGVSSDTGRQQGLDLLKAKYSAGQFSGAADIIKKDVAARKSGLIGDNRYLQRQYVKQAAPAGGGGQIQEGATATGPNGHKIKFTGGKWTDAASGAPIQ